VRRFGHSGRVDRNQPMIVKGLRQIGASVQSLATMGGGCPDLLVGYQGENYLMEIKDPDAPKNKRDLTPDQVKWHAEWKGIINVVETLDEAFRVIGR